MNTRRHFLFRLAVTASAPFAICDRLLAQNAPAAAPQAPAVKLEESDPVATALGYKEDTTKVDAQKYPQHKPDQKCEGCALYTGKPGEASGPCTAFQNKIVTANGWCAAFAKKP